MDTTPSRSVQQDVRALSDCDLKERRARLAERVCRMCLRLHLLDDEIIRRSRERELADLRSVPMVEAILP